MRRAARVLIAVLYLCGVSEAGSIIGGQFSFTAVSTWADLKPSFLIGRNTDGIFALFLPFGGYTPMNGLSYWEGTLEEGRLGYFEYTLSVPLIYQGVYYPAPVLTYLCLDFFFGTLRAPAQGGPELVFERVPVRLKYSFWINNPRSENPFDETSFTDFGFVHGSARGFAKLRFFGEFLDDGARRYWLYALREARIDLVQTPEPATCGLAGAGLLFVWLGRRLRRCRKPNSSRPSGLGASAESAGG